MAESRICFVVSELLGIVRNGGIATATTYAGLVMADAGYDVTLFYCGEELDMEREWADRYDRAGVTVRWLERAQAANPKYVADSFRVYRQLKDSQYDAIVFQDWRGLGYCSMVAKGAGLAFAATRLIHACHGPDEWLREANSQLMLDGQGLTQSHLERRSAELADCLVSPSRYLLDWMAEAGWQLPPDQHVIPNFTEGATQRVSGPEPKEQPQEPEPLTELVFFGRLEERKGVRLFATALNLLGPETLQGMAVTFLGREASFTHDQVVGFISPKVRERLGSLSLFGNLDQGRARAYLREPGRLALIPSYVDNSPGVVYECIEDGVPFFASLPAARANCSRPRTGRPICSTPRRRRWPPPFVPCSRRGRHPARPARRSADPPAWPCGGHCSRRPDPCRSRPQARWSPS